MLKGMRYVYEVYQEMSFSKAARNLYISQPSLSAAIKKVEHEIGCTIFDRSTNPIQITECGKAYIDSIKKIMEIEESFDNFKNDLENMKTGSISIGGTTFLHLLFFHRLFSVFPKHFHRLRSILLKPIQEC